MGLKSPDSRHDPEDRPTTFNLLFVCSGNTCRSPLAKAIAKALLRERGWNHVRVESAGTSAATGMPASPNALLVARENDLDLESHRSQPLSRDLLDWADVVLAMGAAHAAYAERLHPDRQVALVTDFVAGAGAGQQVADPFGGDVDEYRRTYHQLNEAVTAVIRWLARVLSP